MGITSKVYCGPVGSCKSNFMIVKAGESIVVKLLMLARDSSVLAAIHVQYSQHASSHLLACPRSTARKLPASTHTLHVRVI